MLLSMDISTFATATLKVLEGLSYIVQLVMVVGLFIAWKQVQLGITDIRLKSKREAGFLAIQQAEVFAEKIIPKWAILDDKKLIAGIKTPAISLNNYYRSELFAKGKAERERFEATINLLQKNGDLFGEMNDLANRIDSVAMCFTKELADDGVVFGSLAPAFCEFVRRHYYFYCFQREKNSIPLFNDTIELYKNWSARLQASEGEIKVRDLKKQIEIINKNKPDFERLTPLGSDIS